MITPMRFFSEEASLTLDVVIVSCLTIAFLLGWLSVSQALTGGLVVQIWLCTRASRSALATRFYSEWHDFGLESHVYDFAAMTAEVSRVNPDTNVWFYRHFDLRRDHDEGTWEWREWPSSIDRAVEWMREWAAAIRNKNPDLAAAVKDDSDPRDPRELEHRAEALKAKGAHWIQLAELTQRRLEIRFLIFMTRFPNSRAKRIEARADADKYKRDPGHARFRSSF